MQDGQPNHDVAVPTPVFLTNASRRLDTDTAISLQEIESAEMGLREPDIASLGRITSISLPNLTPSPCDLTTSNSARSTSSNGQSSTQQADFPWTRQNGVEALFIKRRGYPSLANLLNSHEDLMIYRRFGFLQARLLLEKQRELCALERTLDQLDREEAQEDARQPITRDLSDDRLPRRKTLLNLIEEKFCSYVSLVEAAQKMVAMNPPMERHYRSVRDYMYNHQSLVEREAEWIHPKEDLIALKQRPVPEPEPRPEHAWLDLNMERFVAWLPASLVKRSRNDSGHHFIYYLKRQISRFENVTSALISLTMMLVVLIVPIYILFNIFNHSTKEEAYTKSMWVLVGATITFSAILSMFTMAKRHGILAAAAAYCAVLVVFLGNIGPDRV